MAHEPCWYAVRKGARASWQGGRKQTTVWEAASPITGFGFAGRGEDAVTAHPTQKPLELFERPILNHIKPGEIVYDPFCGSGTSLIAAAKHGRRALAIELDPAWCDVIRARYEAFARDPRGEVVDRSAAKDAHGAVREGSFRARRESIACCSRARHCPGRASRSCRIASGSATSEAERRQLALEFERAVGSAQESSPAS